MKDFIEIDDQKNIVRCLDNYVFVKIFNKNSWIEVGFFSNDNFHIGSVYRLNNEDNMFKKSNSWGVNKIVLCKMTKGNILINTMNGLFCVSYKEIITHPKLTLFSQKGFADQYIVPQLIMKRMYEYNIRY